MDVLEHHHDGPGPPIRSKNIRHAANRFSWSPTPPSSTPRRCARRGPTKRRSASSGTCLCDRRRELRERRRRSSSSRMPARPDHLRERPERDAFPVGEATPLVPPDVVDESVEYLLNSHASRDFPMPRSRDRDHAYLPMTAESWKSSLMSRSSRAARERRLDGGRSCPAPAPTTRGARQSAHPLLLALQLERPGVLEGDQPSPRGTSTRPPNGTGLPTDWSREAVLTHSPVTIPCLRAAATAASPVSTPALARSRAPRPPPPSPRPDPPTPRPPARRVPHHPHGSWAFPTPPSRRRR